MKLKLIWFKTLKYLQSNIRHYSLTFYYIKKVLGLHKTLFFIIEIYYEIYKLFMAKSLLFITTSLIIFFMELKIYLMPLDFWKKYVISLSLNRFVARIDTSLLKWVCIIKNALLPIFYKYFKSHLYWGAFQFFPFEIFSLASFCCSRCRSIICI